MAGGKVAKCILPSQPQITQKGVVMTNKERRQSGLGYISDKQVFAEQTECRKLLKQLNSLDTWDYDGIKSLVHKIFGKCGENSTVNLPFTCEYGYNITIGDNFYANFGCTMLDGAPITIGSNVQIAPNVSLYTAGHPVYPSTRNSLYEYCKPIKIGSNTWIGGGTIVCPGVTIGSNTVIGAGSVVTKDIPDWVIAAGNPCRVIRKITDADKRKLFKNELIDDEAWGDILSKTEGEVKQ